jgi:hypothetical protein
VKKWAKELNGAFLKEEAQVAEKLNILGHKEKETM